MPYMKNGKRNYGIDGELGWEHRHPERTKQREARHVARAHDEKKGLVHKGDGKQVDHIKPLSQGGAASDANTRVVSTHANESFARTKTGAIASKPVNRRNKK